MPEFLCFAINSFGTGGHPVATPENLSLFKREYIAASVRRAVQSGKISGRALDLAEQYETEN